MRRRWALCIGHCALAAALAAASGCAKARAETVPDGPPLTVPAPPPRVLAPVDTTLAAAEPESEPIPPAEPRATTATPTRRPAARAGESESRTDAAGTTPPAAAPGPTTPSEPTRELRAAGSADADVERKVRDLLTRAGRDLNRIDYRRLSPEGRAQYDESKRFSERAEEAIKDRNFVFAETFADKASALAAQLVGR